MRTTKTMTTRDGLGRCAVVTGIACVVLAASAGPAAAQPRYFDSLLRMSMTGEPGSRIGLSIDDVADNDAAAEGAMVRDVFPDIRRRPPGLPRVTLSSSSTVSGCAAPAS